MPIRRVGHVLNGGTPTSAPENWGGEVPFVTPPDLNGADGAVLESTGRMLSKVGTYGAGIAPAGSVLVSTRAPIGHVGRVAEMSAFNQGCRAVAPRKGMDPRYVAAALVAARAELIARGQGTTFLELSSSAFASVSIPVPPRDEQCAIADYLDHETAQIDALVAKQEEFIGLLKERRRSQISDTFAVLGSPNTQLRRVAHIQTGITLSGDGDPSQPSWPYLRVANVQMGRVDLSHVKEIHLPAAEAATSMLRAGDVLMTEGGDIDKLGRGTVWDGSVERMVHQNHVFAVRAKPGRLVPSFLAWWLDTSIAREYFYLTAKKTTNLASTNKTVVGRLPIHVPDISRQDETVTRICEQVGRIDVLIAKAEEHVALAKERRAALITAAVTGQFDVRTAHKGVQV